MFFSVNNCHLVQEVFSCSSRFYPRVATKSALKVSRYKRRSTADQGDALSLKVASALPPCFPSKIPAAGEAWRKRGSVSRYPPVNCPLLSLPLLKPRASSPVPLARPVHQSERTAKIPNNTWGPPPFEDSSLMNTSTRGVFEVVFPFASSRFFPFFPGVC